MLGANNVQQSQEEQTQGCVRVKDVCRLAKPTPYLVNNRHSASACAWP